MQHSPWRAAALLAALVAASMTLVACGSPAGGTGVAQVITVTYIGGKIEGGGRKQVTKGSTVTLQVTSDIVDEVHLHGYDKAVDTIANQPVQIVFKADASGVFEVELEKKGLKLVDIEVK